MPPVVLVLILIALSQVVALALWNRVAAAVAGRDARRNLPRAGAAATAGGAIAGLGAGALIPRLGVDAIPLIAAAIAAIAGGVCVMQQRALAADGSPGATAPAGVTEVLGSPQRALLRALVVIALLEAIVSTTIDLQFASALKHRYTGETLAIAVSLFYGGTNGILLLLQLAAVPRLLVTRSLPFTMTIHPAFVIATYAVFGALPSFLTIAGMRTGDQVLHLATSRTTQELALSALPPIARARWKVLLRGAFAPVGIGLAGVGLLLAGPAAIQDRTALAVVAIAVAVAWGISARVTARRFGVALAAPLGVRTRVAAAAARLDLDTLEQWSAVAGGDDASAAALARAAIVRARIDIEDLGEHLRHDSPGVRAALFEQLARVPTPSLRGELRAALAIEDDDHALALAIEARASAGDDSGLERGRARATLSTEVAAAVRSAEQMLRGGDARAELGVLCARDPLWALALVRARRGELTDDILDAALREAADLPARRAGALAVIAHVGPTAALPIVIDALVAGEPAAATAIAGLDADGAAYLTAALPALSSIARAAIARALGGAPAASIVLAALIGDHDPEVAYPALRTALAVARGGGDLPAAAIAEAHATALAETIGLLEVRDCIAGGGRMSELGVVELEIATRRCVARLLWAAAVEAAAAGRDPGPLSATARHLLGGRDADRKRALDVVQELATERPEMLAVIERWLAGPRKLAQPIAELTDIIADELGRADPWLAELDRSTPALAAAMQALRRCALFGSIAGPALAALAARATMRQIDGELFAIGAAGDSMFVIDQGEVIARRAGQPDREIAAGGVVGEVAVLTHAPRASTVTTGHGGATLLEIDCESFAAAARRAPELVLGLAATLAGWLAPNRPDVL